MLESTPYQTLGVREDASYEEIRDARDRLLAATEGDESQQEAIESAYDAILMDRLRARQENRIKVPDQIRYPERLSSSFVTNMKLQAAERRFNWVWQWLDRPPLREVLITSGLFAGLALLALFTPLQPSTNLAIALLVSVILLTRKERKFGRALLLAIAALMVGFASAWVLDLLRLSGGSWPSPIQVVAILVWFWLVTLFGR
ncbi:MAG: molecular chaperone DnaJ [Oscillatoriales cyanobacterium SM2_2_1]|nr:molecular chaperone DnaJ [Oscillatoriales cyanobacterium SM2_2_1]